MTENTARWMLVLLLVGVGSLTATAEPASEPQVAPPAGQETEDSLADMIPQWVRNLKIFGDLRYRHEAADDHATGINRHRHRIRARLGITAKVNDAVKVTVGLASGTNESATNTNQDLDGAFSSKDLWLDLAYFDYTCGRVDGLNVFGGKFKNPFIRVGNSDLLFDTDVRPEGIGGKYKTSLSQNMEFFSAFGGHYVEERSTAAETSLWAVQGGVTCKLPQIDGGSVTAGAGYFDFGNVEGQQALGTSATNFRGNTSVGGVYQSDYNIVQGFGQFGFTALGQPCKLFGDVLYNEAASSGKDTGYLVGAGIGKCKKPGSWQFAYNYRKLEADATVAAMVDSTIGGGGTNIKGHKFSVGYQIAKNVKLAANAMFAQRTRTTTDDYNVFQLEGVFKF